MSDRDSARQGFVRRNVSGIFDGSASARQRSRSVVTSAVLLSVGVGCTAAGIDGAAFVVAHESLPLAAVAPDLAMAGFGAITGTVVAGGAAIFGEEYPGAGWVKKPKRALRRNLLRHLKNVSCVPAIGLGAVAVASAVIPGASGMAVPMGEVAAGFAGLAAASGVGSRIFAIGADKPTAPRALGE